MKKLEVFLAMAFITLSPVASAQNYVDQQDCENAKRGYQMEANSRYPNAAEVKARRDLMYVTCGIQAPNEVNVTTNNYNNDNRNPPPNNVQRPCTHPRDVNCIKQW